MEMLRKLFVALVGTLFVASLGTAYAVTPSQGGYTGDTLQQTDAPKDCKKNPNDPRCKDAKDVYTGDTTQQTDAPKDCKKNPNDPRCKDDK